jgi:prephenate dehydrogenase
MTRHTAEVGVGVGEPIAPPRHLHVVGAGLIGTSVALIAGHAGWQVTVEDVDPARAERARVRLLDVAYSSEHARRDGGVRDLEGPTSEPDLILLAIPPALVGVEVVHQLREHVDATVMDVASVKAEPQRYVQAHSPHASRFVPTHPLAGGEGSGPDSARSDLFRGRSWVLCPSVDIEDARARLVITLVHLCGAEPVWLTAAEHDRLLAVTSHLPQLIASALAAEVTAAFGAPHGAEAGGLPASSLTAQDPIEGWERPPPSLLAGPALLDMTRIAASPSELWAQVVSLNLPFVRAALGGLTDRLQALQASFTASPEAAISVRELVDHGRTARASLGRKHAGTSAEGVSTVPSGRWWWVDTTIDDTPGTLARVFAMADKLGVNVEDVRVDHAPYASSGIVSVAIGDERAAERLRLALRGESVDD